jgi:hypothetical protein
MRTKQNATLPGCLDAAQIFMPHNNRTQFLVPLDLRSHPISLSPFNPPQSDGSSHKLLLIIPAPPPSTTIPRLTLTLRLAHIHPWAQGTILRGRRLDADTRQLQLRDPWWVRARSHQTTRSTSTVASFSNGSHSRRPARPRQLIESALGVIPPYTAALSLLLVSPLLLL